MYNQNGGGGAPAPQMQRVKHTTVIERPHDRNGDGIPDNMAGFNGNARSGFMNQLVHPAFRPGALSIGGFGGRGQTMGGGGFDSTSAPQIPRPFSPYGGMPPGGMGGMPPGMGVGGPLMPQPGPAFNPMAVYPANQMRTAPGLQYSPGGPDWRMILQQLLQRGGGQQMPDFFRRLIGG